MTDMKYGMEALGRIDTQLRHTEKLPAKDRTRPVAIARSSDRRPGRNDSSARNYSPRTPNADTDAESLKVSGRGQRTDVLYDSARLKVASANRASAPMLPGATDYACRFGCGSDLFSVYLQVIGSHGTIKPN